ncbi:Chloroplast protein FOR GROWTH AND FERTILITY 2-like protein [Drosera capensis]
MDEGVMRGGGRLWFTNSNFWCVYNKIIKQSWCRLSIPKPPSPLPRWPISSKSLKKSQEAVISSKWGVRGPTSMERLIHSSPCSSHLLLTHSKPYRPLPPSRLGPVKSLKFGLYSLPRALKSGRVLSSFSSRHGGFSLFSDSSSQSSPRASSLADSSSNALSSDSGLSRKAVDAGKIILLTTLAMVVIHPFLTTAALARFPNPAKVRNAAAATGMGRGLLRTEILISAWTGFSAGCLHTLSGPEHLAACAPLSIGRTRMESAVVGALWGCGHDAGPAPYRDHQDLGTIIVGLTLLVIGAICLKEASEGPTPCIALENGECCACAGAAFSHGWRGSERQMQRSECLNGIDAFLTCYYRPQRLECVVIICHPYIILEDIYGNPTFRAYEIPGSIGPL